MDHRIRLVLQQGSLVKNRGSNGTYVSFEPIPAVTVLGRYNHGQISNETNSENQKGIHHLSISF